MSEQKIFDPNNAIKMVQNRCKSAQTSTKYWSVTMKLGPNITCHSLNLIAQVLGLHLVYQWCHLCKIYMVQEGENTASGGCIRMG